MKIDISKAAQFVAAGSIEALEPQVKSAQEALEQGTCPGNDFLGWMHLPSSITPEFIAEINATAKVLQENCEAVVVAGIGGSYLGARMVIDALSNTFGWLQPSDAPRILFAGNNIGEDYLSELIGYLKNVKFGVINISKSGTTTETAITFRLLKKMCEDQRGKEEAKKVIVAMEHTQKGAPKILKQCTLPLTTQTCVTKIITEMGVMVVTPDGLVLTEYNPEFTVEQIQAATEAQLIISPDLKSMLD